LRALPGVGDYTAGAILSIAYNKPAPAVDGNIRRVISRLYDVDASATELRSYASDLVDSDRPGDFNQSLMELGARVCTSRSPSCFACPVASQCHALRNQTVHLRPAVKAKKEIPHYIVRTVVHVDGNRVLIAHRPATGLLAGLWEFTTRDTTPKSAAHLGEITHIFTHQRITYDVHLLHSKRSPKGTERWVRLSDLHQFALPAAQRKIEKLVKHALSCV
jgi:A/G-specific adenine glycosylase